MDWLCGSIVKHAARSVADGFGKWLQKLSKSSPPALPVMSVCAALDAVAGALSAASLLTPLNLDATSMTGALR